MAPAGFEPEILASERPQTHALDRTATGTCFILHYECMIDVKPGYGFENMKCNSL
jgi:hypothetical protein